MCVIKCFPTFSLHEKISKQKSRPFTHQIKTKLSLVRGIFCIILVYSSVSSKECLIYRKFYKQFYYFSRFFLLFQQRSSLALCTPVPVLLMQVFEDFFAWVAKEVVSGGGLDRLYPHVSRFFLLSQQHS